MWNKRTDELPTMNKPEGGTETRNFAAAPVARQEQPPVASPNQQIAVIGPSMNIKGEIRTREELFVDGEVEGSLESQSVLTVGKNGKVKANIKARVAVVFGTVRGNIEATEKIAIRDNGSVIGDIRTAGISIDDGAYFKGNIDISRPEPKPKPVKEEKPVREEVRVAAGQPVG
jgi:cytoskeletal protein CcmA (bactofilin family)